MRISGVNVDKVKRKEQDDDTGLTDVESTEGPLPTLGADITDPILSLLNQFVFDIVNAGGVVAPPCREQAPLGRVVGQPGKYPQLQPNP